MIFRTSVFLWEHCPPVCKATSFSFNGISSLAQLYRTLNSGQRATEAQRDEKPFAVQTNSKRWVKNDYSSFVVQNVQVNL